MHITVIIDVILAAVLLVCLIRGLVRGLFLSLAGLLVMVAALVGANLVSNALSPPVTEALRPAVESYIIKRVDNALNQEVAPDPPDSGASTPTVPEAGGGTPTLPQDIGIPEDLSVVEQAERILEALGLKNRISSDLTQRIEQTVRDTSVSVISAVTDNLLLSVVRTVLFLLSFVALFFVLSLAVRALDLVLKLPGLHLLNALGGGALGLAQGLLLLYVAFWVLARFGVRLSAQTIGDTWFLQFFVTNGPLGFLSSF